MKQDYHHLRPGLVQKIDYSIALLRKAEALALRYDADDGFYLAFSGGKDSQCLYHVAQLAGVRFKAHFSPTSIDPPQLIRFIRRNYPDCEFTRLRRSIFTAALKHTVLPTANVRWCCAEFKETSGAGKVTLIGIRHAESARRAKRKEVGMRSYKFSGDFDEFLAWQEEQIHKKFKNLNQDQFSYDKESTVRCINGKDGILVSPIIRWTDEDVWDFLDGMEIEHCELYDMGYTRIGCILCPMSRYKDKLLDIQLFPHVKEKWIQTLMKKREENPTWFEKFVSQFAARTGCPQSTSLTLPDSVGGTEREIAENIFDWWISGKPYSKWFAEKFQQLKIDFND